jgi:hypothetical protein
MNKNVNLYEGFEDLALDQISYAARHCRLKFCDLTSSQLVGYLAKMYPEESLYLLIKDISIGEISGMLTDEDLQSLFSYLLSSGDVEKSDIVKSILDNLLVDYRGYVNDMAQNAIDTYVEDAYYSSADDELDSAA